MDRRSRQFSLALLLAAGIAIAGEPGARAVTGQPVVKATRGAVVRALEAALILSGQEGGAVRTAILAAPLPAAGDGRRLQVLLEIEGAGLLAEHGGERLEVAVFLYALDTGGEVVAATSRHLDLDLELHRERLLRTGLKIPAVLAIGDDEHLLRVLVRSETEAFGLRSAVVPPATDTGGVLSSPLLLEQAGRWLLAIGPGEEAEPPAWPWTAAGESFLPASLPVVTSDRPARGLLLVGEPPPRDSGGSVALKRNATGALAELPISDRRVLPTAWPGVHALAFEFDTPGLAPGTYTFRVRLEADDSDLDSPPGVLVVAPAHGPAEASWPELDLGALDLGVVRRQARDEIAPDERRVGDADELPPDLVAGGLEASLANLARGDLTAATRGVRDLHTHARSLLAGEALRGLGAAEWSHFEELAAAGRENLLPVLCLYTQTAIDYRERRELALAAHSARLAVRLAEAYAGRIPTDEIRVDSALALVSLGGSLLVVGDLTSAARAFETALELAGDQPTPLLGLAAIYERLGREQEAVAILERLAGVAPDHAEGRLRLALNLRRTAEVERSKELLSELRSIAQPEWVAALAHQEAARAALAEGRREEAAAILDAAARRWPGNVPIRLLRAWSLELQRRPREAGAALVGLEDGVATPGPSERHRYSAWPQEVLDTDAAPLVARSRMVLMARSEDAGFAPDRQRRPGHSP